MNETVATKYSWNDNAWMRTWDERQRLDLPIAVYEVDLSSWRHVPEDHDRQLSGEELARQLVDYVRQLNFTHVALLRSTDLPFHEKPEELMCLIDALHQANIGVILDVPSAAEIAHPIFAKFHADGLRSEDQIVLNGSSPFRLQGDAHWARDILYFFSRDPIHRKYHYHEITARSDYAFSHHAILSLSHEKVMDGRGSLLNRMPGDEWQKFANLRLLYAFMYAQPGKKNLFMGGEFGQEREWNPNASLDWHLVQPDNPHGKLQRLVAELNRFYRQQTAFHQTDDNASGFEWVDTSDLELTTLSWLRKNSQGTEVILAVFNFTPIPRHNYRVGVPLGGWWREVLNSDAHEYGGSGQGNLGGVEASPLGWNSQSHSLTLTLPPLGAVFFKCEQS